jgi:predicted TPR repeat methyltransferase
MQNPWQEIPFEQYESHMSHQSVGQLQALSNISRSFLQKYKPVSFAIAGACTGNGLEHVNNDITKNIYCIDINPQFLEIAMQRFGSALKGLQMINADLDKDKITIRDCDLIIAALVFEYVDCGRLLETLKGMLSKDGVLVVVIQKSSNQNFVSDTGNPSLRSLTSFAKEIDAVDLINLASAIGIEIYSMHQMPLRNGKSFIIMEFGKKN